jgi:selenoprotein W-related protein
LPKAVSLTEELMNQFRGRIAGINLIPSSGGVFEVEIEGERIFSKKELNRFPEEEEISRLLEEKELLKRSPS